VHRAATILGVWLALLGLLLSGLATAARAQTISPVIVEYREKARGKFQLVNDSIQPLSVVLEPRSFTVDEQGKPTFRALDPQIRLRLSTMSFRLAPRQTYTVFYQATAGRLPAWFTIYATITGPAMPAGIKVALELPHTVYLLTKKPLTRASVQVLRAEIQAGRVEAELENRGQEFSRVQEVEITSASGKKTYPGFPFFPGQRRSLQLDWHQPGQPQRLVLKFAQFKLEHPIRPASGSP
jgi:hypothetical protein